MPGSTRPKSPLSGDFRTRSIFSQGSSFTLDTFSSRDFIVKDFIESLSEIAAPSNRRSGPVTKEQAFDPRPLIRSFEHALDKLSELSEELEGRETELSAAVRKAESQHNSNIESLSRRLDKSLDSFRKLDNSLNGFSNGEEAGGNEAVKIGEKLEELDNQRARARDAQFLIRCWLEICERGDIFTLEDRRQRARGEELVQVAKISRQLLKLSQRLDPKSWRDVNGGAAPNGINGTDNARNPNLKFNTREIVEKFVETLEKDLLTQFDDFYKRDKYEGMREYAEVLQDFGGGASVIGTFVNQHPFFLERSQLATEEVDASPEMWETLADPDAEIPETELSLRDLVDDVRLVVEDESRVIKKAFSYYELVMGRFIQRIFQQSLQQRLEMVLEKASTVSALAFLRSLQSARGYISAMVDALKVHGLTEHPEPLSTVTALVLDQQFDDLFVPYFASSSYIEREKKNLEELYSSLLFKFTIYHSRRSRGPTTILASLAKSGHNFLNSARDAALDRLDSSDLAPQQKKMLLRVAGLKENDSAKKQAENELSEQDGLVKTNSARRMLKWLAEAVGRGLELTAANEIPKNVNNLLDLVLQAMGRQYIEVGLDAALDAATAQETAKNEPDLSYLEHVNALVTCMHLMLATINTVLIPLAASNAFIRREMEKKASTSLGQMEDKVNQLMQKTIDVTITWVGKLLATQKKTDFRPKEDLSGGGAWLQLLQTPTCHSVFNFLSKVHQHTSNALSPSANLSSFLMEIAINLRAQLLEHFKKFQVSAMGGIMVTKDISKYSELLRGWHLDASFAPSMEVLTEIGNTFVIGPDALRERLRGRQGAVGGAWDVADLRPYILKREDANSVGVIAALGAL